MSAVAAPTAQQQLQQLSSAGAQAQNASQHDEGHASASESEGQGSAIHEPQRSLQEEESGCKSALSAAEADVAGPSRSLAGRGGAPPPRQTNSMISTAVQPASGPRHAQEQQVQSPKAHRTGSVAGRTNSVVSQTAGAGAHHHPPNHHIVGVPSGGTPASVYGQLSLPRVLAQGRSSKVSGEHPRGHLEAGQHGDRRSAAHMGPAVPLLFGQPMQAAHADGGLDPGQQHPGGSAHVQPGAPGPQYSLFGLPHFQLPASQLSQAAMAAAAHAGSLHSPLQSMSGLLAQPASGVVLPAQLQGMHGIGALPWAILQQGILPQDSSNVVAAAAAGMEVQPSSSVLAAAAGLQLPTSPHPALSPGAAANQAAAVAAVAAAAVAAAGSIAGSAAAAGLGVADLLPGLHSLQAGLPAAGPGGPISLMVASTGSQAAGALGGGVAVGGAGGGQRSASVPMGMALSHGSQSKAEGMHQAGGHMRAPGGDSTQLAQQMGYPPPLPYSAPDMQGVPLLLSNPANLPAVASLLAAAAPVFGASSSNLAVLQQHQSRSAGPAHAVTAGGHLPQAHAYEVQGAMVAGHGHAGSPRPNASQLGQDAGGPGGSHGHGHAVGVGMAAPATSAAPAIGGAVPGMVAAVGVSAAGGGIDGAQGSALDMEVDVEAGQAGDNGILAPGPPSAGCQDDAPGTELGPDGRHRAGAGGEASLRASVVLVAHGAEVSSGHVAGAGMALSIHGAQGAHTQAEADGDNDAIGENEGDVGMADEGEVEVEAVQQPQLAASVVLGGGGGALAGGGVHAVTQPLHSMVAANNSMAEQAAYTMSTPRRGGGDAEAAEAGPQGAEAVEEVTGSQSLSPPPVSAAAPSALVSGNRAMVDAGQQVSGARRDRPQGNLQLPGGHGHSHHYHVAAGNANAAGDPAAAQHAVAEGGSAMHAGGSPPPFHHHHHHSTRHHPLGVGGAMYAPASGSIVNVNPYHPQPLHSVMLQATSRAVSAGEAHAQHVGDGAEVEAQGGAAPAASVGGVEANGEMEGVHGGQRGGMSVERATPSVHGSIISQGAHPQPLAQGAGSNLDMPQRSALLPGGGGGEGATPTAPDVATSGMLGHMPRGPQSRASHSRNAGFSGNGGGGASGGEGHSNGPSASASRSHSRLHGRNGGGGGGNTAIWQGGSGNGGGGAVAPCGGPAALEVGGASRPRGSTAAVPARSGSAGLDGPGTGRADSSMAEGQGAGMDGPAVAMIVGDGPATDYASDAEARAPFRPGVLSATPPRPLPSRNLEATASAQDAALNGGDEGDEEEGGGDDGDVQEGGGGVSPGPAALGMGLGGMHLTGDVYGANGAGGAGAGGASGSTGMVGAAHGAMGGMGANMDFGLQAARAEVHGPRPIPAPEIGSLGQELGSVGGVGLRALGRPTLSAGGAPGTAMDTGTDPGVDGEADAEMPAAAALPPAGADTDADHVHPATSVHATVIAEEAVSEFDTDLSSMHIKREGSSVPVGPQAAAAHAHQLLHGHGSSHAPMHGGADHAQSHPAMLHGVLMGAGHGVWQPGAGGPGSQFEGSAAHGDEGMGGGDMNDDWPGHHPGANQGVGLLPGAGGIASGSRGGGVGSGGHAPGLMLAGVEQGGEVGAGLAQAPLQFRQHNSSIAMVTAGPSTRSGTISGGGPSQSNTVGMSTLADSQMANASPPSSGGDDSSGDEGGNARGNAASRQEGTGYQHSADGGGDDLGASPAQPARSLVQAADARGAAGSVPTAAVSVTLQPPQGALGLGSPATQEVAQVASSMPLGGPLHGGGGMGTVHGALGAGALGAGAGAAAHGEGGMGAAPGGAHVVHQPQAAVVSGWHAAYSTSKADPHAGVGGGPHAGGRGRAAGHGGTATSGPWRAANSTSGVVHSSNPVPAQRVGVQEGQGQGGPAQGAGSTVGGSSPKHGSAPAAQAESGAAGGGLPSGLHGLGLAQDAALAHGMGVPGLGLLPQAALAAGQLPHSLLAGLQAAGVSQHGPAHSGTAGGLQGLQLAAQHLGSVALLELWHSAQVLQQHSSMSHVMHGLPGFGAASGGGGGAAGGPQHPHGSFAGEEGAPQVTEVTGAFALHGLHPGHHPLHGGVHGGDGHGQAENNPHYNQQYHDAVQSTSLSGAGRTTSAVQPQDTEVHGIYANLMATAAAAQLAAAHPWPPPHRTHTHSSSQRPFPVGGGPGGGEGAGPSMPPLGGDMVGVSGGGASFGHVGGTAGGHMGLGAAQPLPLVLAPGLDPLSQPHSDDDDGDAAVRLCGPPVPAEAEMQLGGDGEEEGDDVGDGGQGPGPGSVPAYGTDMEAEAEDGARPAPAHAQIAGPPPHQQLSIATSHMSNGPQLGVVAMGGGLGGMGHGHSHGQGAQGGPSGAEGVGGTPCGHGCAVDGPGIGGQSSAILAPSASAAPAAGPFPNLAADQSIDGRFSWSGRGRARGARARGHVHAQEHGHLREGGGVAPGQHEDVVASTTEVSHPKGPARGGPAHGGPGGLPGHHATHHGDGPHHATSSAWAMAGGHHHHGLHHPGLWQAHSTAADQGEGPLGVSTSRPGGPPMPDPLLTVENASSGDADDELEDPASKPTRMRRRGAAAAAAHAHAAPAPSIGEHAPPVPAADPGAQSGVHMDVGGQEGEGPGGVSAVGPSTRRRSEKRKRSSGGSGHSTSQ